MAFGVDDNVQLVCVVYTVRCTYSHLHILYTAPTYKVRRRGEGGGREPNLSDFMFEYSELCSTRFSLIHCWHTDCWVYPGQGVHRGVCRVCVLCGEGGDPCTHCTACYLSSSGIWISQ